MKPIADSCRRALVVSSITPSGAPPVKPEAAAQVGSPAASPRLLDRLRDALRVRHYAIRTERAYVDWARRFIIYHGKRHPVELGADAVAAFLTHLAVERSVAPSTQNQAKAALRFVYRQVLGTELPLLDEASPPRTRSACRWFSRRPRCGCCCPKT